jgi:hypothetical protein
MSRLPKPQLPSADPPPTSETHSSGQGMVGPTTGTQSDDNLQMPHERDQGQGQVAAAPDPVIEQAAKDLAAGQVDTDMRATPGLDAARRARMVDTPPAPAQVDPGRAAARTGKQVPKRRPG